MPEISQELFDALVGQNAEEIARVIEKEAITTPKGKDPEVEKVDAWFDRINRDNQELAKAYGVPVGPMGVSLGPEVLLITEQIKRYYLNHPEDRFVQKSYSQLLAEGKVSAMIETPEVPSIPKKVTTEIVNALERLPEEKLNALLGAIKELSK